MSTSSEYHIQSLKGGAKQVQISENVSALSGSVTNQVQSCIASNHQSEEVLSIEDMLLESWATESIGTTFAEDLVHILNLFRNYKWAVAEKIEYLNTYLAILDEDYRVAGDLTKKQDILKITEAFKSHISVQKILQYQQRRDNIVEQIFHKSADMFHIGKDVLKENPDISGVGLTQEIEAHFKKQGVGLSGDQKKMLTITIISLEKAKENRQIQLEKIFQKAGVTMPKKLEDIEHVMNTNSNIQFEEWKNYSVKIGGTKYLDTILARDKDATLQIMHQEGFQRDIQNLTQGQKEKIVWHLEGGIETIKFHLTSHPTCIIYRFKKASAYAPGGSNSFGRMHKQTGRIYIRGDLSEKQFHKTIEHEYQHFLNMVFIEPIRAKFQNEATESSYGTDNGSRYIKRFGKKDHSDALMQQWDSMKDEIASYLEHTGILPLDETDYLCKNIHGEIPEELYGNDFGMIDLFNRMLHKLKANNSVKTNDVVDIVRTSNGFEHAYERLRKKYANLIDLPINIKQLNLKGVSEMKESMIMEDIESYSRIKGYNLLFCIVNGNNTALGIGTLQEIGNTILMFELKIETSDPTEIKTFLDDTYQKMNSISDIGTKGDQSEIQNVLKQYVDYFGTIKLGATGYIDHTLKLHSPYVGSHELFDNSPKSQKILNLLFFPNINNVS